MTVGYARVSTKDQKLKSQIDLLKKAGCEKIYSDVGSGVRQDRDGLKEMIGYLRKGDTVITYKNDRIFRSLKNMIELIDSSNEEEDSEAKAAGKMRSTRVGCAGAQRRRRTTSTI